MRLIDADYASNCVGIAEFTKTLNMMPTKDAKPVIHAHWVAKEEMIRHPYARNYYCSWCKFEPLERGNYCPHCGAIMDEVADETKE